MKAAVCTEYGTPDVLKLRDIEKPVPRDNEVQIKVHAASVNDYDLGMLYGKPFLNRLPFNFRKPQIEILGCDIAGTVEKVGKNVKLFKPGDEVFGDICECGWGGFAEYVCAHENALMLKPTGMTFEQAAATPQASILALQSFRKKKVIKPGEKVLINGAGGGAGTFAVQIAKYFGAEVTGVDSTLKLDTMSAVGADHVIDYTREDFTKNRICYDLIVDMAAHHSLYDYKAALNPDGVYVVTGGSTAVIFQTMLLGPWITIGEAKRMNALLHKPNKELNVITELFEKGKVKPVIDKCFPLSDTAEALRYFDSGKTRGKIVITL